jgi:hypothetical protein
VRASEGAGADTRQILMTSEMSSISATATTTTSRGEVKWAARSRVTSNSSLRQVHSGFVVMMAGMLRSSRAFRPSQRTQEMEVMCAAEEFRL